MREGNIVVLLLGGPADGEEMCVDSLPRFIGIGPGNIARYERVPSDGATVLYRFIPSA